MSRQNSSLDPLKLTRWLFILNALIWLALGITGLVRASSTNPDNTISLWIVAILMFGNAAAMLVSGIVITNQRRLYYFFALAVVSVNIILTFTDQFGLLDFLTLVIDIFILALMIASWRLIFNRNHLVK